MRPDPQTEAAANRSRPTLSAARLTLAAKRARIDAGDSADLLWAEPLAIVGIGCRFPGKVKNTRDYWKLLSEGRSGIRRMPRDRWSEHQDRLPANMLAGGYLDEVDRFDAEFFNIAPREAHSIDPQQRLLLEVCWEALSDAGIRPSLLSGTETGAFVAIYSSDYLRLQLHEDAVIDSHTGVGAAHSVAAGRLSFLLNLRGPSMAIDTACSSSLVAIHLACQSLRRRECDTALVGATSLKLLPDEVRAFSQWGMLAKDGQAKTFDAAADGFVPGEGAALVVVKRLSDAIAQGDRVRAVIRGTAVNHDGRSTVLTAPNGPAQEAVIRSALRDAHVSALDVSYVETHGTGTSLGDPIEVEALDSVYGFTSSAGSDASVGACVLGAVKTNIGHLEASAGLAGLIKVVLSLQNESIPTNLNFKTLNPQISLNDRSRLTLANGLTPWPRMAQPRFAAVSSFGLGGTNAHVILEECPVLPRKTDGETIFQSGKEICLPISAHTQEGVLTVANGYLSLLRQGGCDLPALAQAAARTRDHGLFRIAVTGSNAGEVADRLELKIHELTALPAAPFQPEKDLPRETKTAIGFVFSGQGCAWSGMLHDLVASFPLAEKLLSQFEKQVHEFGGWSLKEAASDPSALNDTARSQPLIYAVQVALVRVLESWGIHPTVVVGHSVGEVGAAVTGGILSVEQGLDLALKRGRQMGSRSPGDEIAGRMLAAEMTTNDAAFYVGSFKGATNHVAVEIAAHNGPNSVVFSGSELGIQKLEGALRQDSISTRMLDVQYAFHSRAMEAASSALKSDLMHDLGIGMERRSPKLPIISTVTGEQWKSSDGDPAYWSKGVREPVLFYTAMKGLLEQGCRTVVEIGPHPVLARAISSCVADQGGRDSDHVKTAGSMRKGQSVRTSLIKLVSVAYEAGHDLDWEKIYPGSARQAELPAYPWNKQRYWLADRPARSAPMRSVPDDGSLLGQERSSPFLEGRLWESSISTEKASWLSEHRLRDEPILPFAAWLEMARQAAYSASNVHVSGSGYASVDGPGVVLREFSVYRALKISMKPVTLQTLAASETHEVKFAVGDGQSWESFAGGFWDPTEDVSSDIDSTARAFDPEHWRRKATDSLSPEAVYQGLAKHGLTYGSSFRLLRKLYRGQGFVLGEVTGASDGQLHVVGEERDYKGPYLQPTVLDACLQTLQAALEDGFQLVPFLPFSVRSYRVIRNSSAVHVLTRTQAIGTDDIEADITVIDSEKRLVAEIKGLRVRKYVDSEKVAPLWKCSWTPIDEIEGFGREERSVNLDLHKWLIPSAREGMRDLKLLESLADEFGQQGASIGTWKLGELTLSQSHSNYSVILAGAPHHIVEQILRLVEIERILPGSVERVCFLTRGAVQAVDGEEVSAEESRPVGLARTFRAEFPAVEVTIVDLPSNTVGSSMLPWTAPQDTASVRLEASALAHHLMRHGHSPAGVGDFALRDGSMLQLRLEKFEPSESIEIDTILRVGTPGLLESLHEWEDSPRDPATNEVQIACKTHGLNFRDVLTAMDSYAGKAGGLGAECAGIVIKAGSASGITPGTCVMAFAPESMRSRVNVLADFVTSIPAGLSFAAAASIPVAFLTAHYAFYHLAGLKTGDTVLIHSAAGGLGQAAIQLARQAGASIIATAGTDEKRTYLRTQGIHHVFDSRSEQFADDVLRVTNGAGVDVVLNSLSGSKIEAGFRALRLGGTFLEVGKRDILTVEQVSSMRPDVQYFFFDLGEVGNRDPALIQEMMRALRCDFENGILSPMNRVLYPMSEARNAIRQMAAGKHIGKLILTQPQRTSTSHFSITRWDSALRDGTVLITGGAGALGLATARWLVSQGARSIVLIGRGPKAVQHGEMQREFASSSAVVVYEQADVTDREQLGRVLSDIRASERGPLRVVFHAAGEINDSLLSEHTATSLEDALRTKRNGARLLGELTREDDLVQTVYYSSIAGLFGSAGQSGYASANAFLDGFAEQRSALGLPTLSVNWGAWAGGGMVDRLSASARSRMSRNGILPMPPDSALLALKQALSSGHSRAVIADVDWLAFKEQFPINSPARSYYQRLFAKVTEIKDTASILEAFTTTGKRPVNRSTDFESFRTGPRSERLPRLEELVRSSVRTVLGLSASRPLLSDQPLQEIGLDSLMALELRNILVQAVGRPLSATLLFDYPSVRELSSYLLSLLFEEAQTESVEAANRFSGDNVHQDSVSARDLDLLNMSDSEAEDLLLAELDRKVGS